MKYAQIIIDISHAKLDHSFTYKVPEDLSDRLEVGSLVEIPFGMGNKTRKGYIVSFSDRADYPDEKIKDILGVARRGDSDTGEMAVRLAVWMKNRYGSTLITALKTVLTARKDAKPVEQREVRLLLDDEAAREKLAFYLKKHQVARARLLESLMDIPEQPYALIVEKLHISAQTMRAMKEQGVLEIQTDTSLRNPIRLKDVGKADIILSPEQQAVVEGVVHDFDRKQSLLSGGLSPLKEAEEIPVCSLIHGITGAGKTEVYISIIESIVSRGRQAIMLIPEISLTYQTLIRFYRHFGDRVSVMNSTLSEGEKSDQFERARRGEIDVIIGPRSALFTPFPNVGIIVIDEEHENSYKNEQMPKYHARDVAMEIARLKGGLVVLGSATPDLSSYYHAKKGDYRFYALTRRLTGGSLPSVEIADMKEELKNGNRGILSRQLALQVARRLEAGEQTMLFLNRRGFSGFVSCRSCGHVMKCPHCDVALSYHRNGKLVCHYCGYEEPMVDKCPECGSPYISGFKAGTEQIEQNIQKMFPTARILRMDADTTRTKGSFEKILSSFANEEADILLGTQMIVKGHDFPKVTLVGILMADLSLYANDYRAAERTFQLLTQAAGRAGRGTRPGDVVIQTYEPEHYAITHASKQDYAGFYEEEISYRTLLRYPPVCHMLAVQITSKTDDHAQMQAGMLRQLLDKITGGSERQKKIGMIIIGPSSASISRIRDEYRYVIYIKCPKYDTLIDCKDRMEALCSWQKNAGRPDMAFAADTYVDFDFDPVNPY